MKPRETKTMKENIKIQYTFKMMVEILNANGYVFKRQRGSHKIYAKAGHNPIAIKEDMMSKIFWRLIRENNLVVDIKKKGKK